MFRYILGPINFVIEETTPISFVLNKKEILSFEFIDVQVHEDNHKHYTGPYTITPRVFSQTLDVNHYVMDDDLVIESIPINSVSNIYGGKTTTIG